MKNDARITNAIGIDSQAESNGHNENEVLRRIASAISGVRFGSVEVVIQDSRVVQIARKEKFRFDKPSRALSFRSDPDEGRSRAHDETVKKFNNRELTGHPEVPQTMRDFRDEKTHYRSPAASADGAGCGAAIPRKARACAGEAYRRSKRSGNP